MCYAYTLNELTYCMLCYKNTLPCTYNMAIKHCYYQEELHHLVVDSVISDTEMHATSYY